MALFKILKGSSQNLPAVYNEGWIYFTTDENKFYIDVAGQGGEEGQRVALVAEPPANINVTTINGVTVGNNPQFTDTLETVALTRAQYDLLTTEEKNNGKVYFITDDVDTPITVTVDASSVNYTNALGTTTVQQELNKIGTSTLSTTANTITSAINELKTDITTMNTSNISAERLPNDVFNVVECLNFASFPGVGATDKIYIDASDNNIYRWDGISQYVKLSPLPTAYGDLQNPYGVKASKYVLAAPANENGAPTFRLLTNEDIGLGNVTNNEQIPKSVLTGQYDILYSSDVGTPAVLAANTTTTRKFIRMVGDGTDATAPAWDVVTKQDVGLGNVDNTADANKVVAEAATLTDLTSTVTELNYVDGVTSNIQTQLNNKQSTLVSGTNIKTINNTSLLGEGNIAVQPTLVSGTNIKTIDNTSLLGDGNIALKTINNVSLLGTGNIEIQGGGGGMPDLVSSSSNKSVYLVGYDSTNDELDYNSTVYFNPSTGGLYATKVYNAVWNDYAEWFEKENIKEKFEPGDIVIWKNKGVTKCYSNNDSCVVGICSNTYGHIIGGEELDDMEDNKNKFVPIGLKGRVKAKVIGEVKTGDLIVTSDFKGCGKVNNNAQQNQIVGKSLESSENKKVKLITILI